MAERPSLFSRTLNFLAPTTDQSPIHAGSPSDDAPAPEVGLRYSRTAEEVLAQAGAWFAGLATNDDSILRREGSQDMRLFDRLLDDDVAMSTLQQRRLAITSRDWEVVPGDDKDPRSVQAADDFREMLNEVGFDRVTAGLHYSIWFGFGVAEALYSLKLHNGRTKYWLDDLIIPDRKLFGFGFDGSLRFHGGLATFGGQEVPANKFVTVRTGGTHDFAFYGLGLAHWVYWPVWFKKAAVRFWALYLEKLSKPTALGGFKETDTPATKNDLVAALVSLGRDSAVIVPEDTMDKIKFMEATRSGAGSSSYREFLTEQNESIMRIVLGQPGTSKATAGGIGSTQADVHADVKAEIVKADADLICDAINNTIARWLTRWNYGDDVRSPRVFRVLDDAEDLNSVAERDASLDAMGWQRTEDSVKQVYGDGYERKPEPVTPPALVPGQVPPRIPGQPPAEFGARDPLPLYVHRKLLNVAEFKSWATSQGLDPVDDDLHVTVLYSKTPVDWFKLGGDYRETVTVEAGGPRKVERLGKTAIALVFDSSDLRWRHEGMIHNGASHDWPTFDPHVTIQFDGDPEHDLTTIEPYVGKLEFGPELFEAIRVDPDPMSVFGAAEEDQIDRLTAALMDEANPVLTEFAAGIRSSIASAKDASGGTITLDGVRVAMLTAFEKFDPATLARLTGLSFVAERAASAAGVEEDIVV